MRKRRAQRPHPGEGAIDDALDAMEAGELREVVREMLLELGDMAHARVVNRLIERAARNSTAWVPASPSDSGVSEALAFAQAAKQEGWAEPHQVDRYLNQGARAFLAKDYPAAFQIFRALLMPLAACEIDLGQHELIDDVLGTCVTQCARQYVVSMYMTASPKERARAVHAAIVDMRPIASIWKPIQDLEDVCTEPLPGLEDFIPIWLKLLEQEQTPGGRGLGTGGQDPWLEEVLWRTEGVAGLARLARQTKQSADLAAWCRALLEAEDWHAILAANQEAAELLVVTDSARGDFLDDAALAAQELGRDDQAEFLERAWRQAPSMLRLRRWLGSSGTQKIARARARQALEVCPGDAACQRALLGLLLGDHERLAESLASAPGLGWSYGDHPGHLLFALYPLLLGASEDLTQECWKWVKACERDWPKMYTEGPSLALLPVEKLVALCGSTAPRGAARDAVLSAMRRAAEKRVEGVIREKRRRHYGHAAELLTTCLVLASGADKWLASIEHQYRRYPALQREIARRLERR